MRLIVIEEDGTCGSSGMCSATSAVNVGNGGDSRRRNLADIAAGHGMVWVDDSNPRWRG